MKLKNTTRNSRLGVLLSFTLIMIIGTLFSKNSFSQSSDSTMHQLNVTEVCKSPWNTPTGIPYAQGPGYNQGITSFAPLEDNKVAYLSGATSEILIVNCNTGQINSRFAVPFAPRDFVYDNGTFYVLSEYLLSMFTVTGLKISDIKYSTEFVGVERIERANNETYLQLPDGSSIAIESDGKPIQRNKKFGWVSRDGSRSYLSLVTGTNSYSVEYDRTDGTSAIQKFTSDKKVAGLYFLGTSNGEVWIDLQTYIAEVPIRIERTLIGIDFSGTPKIVSSIALPNIYYVFTNRDIIANPKGVFDLVTAEDGVHLFLLNHVTNAKSHINGYPKSLLDHSYHYNDHLMQVDVK